MHSSTVGLVLSVLTNTSCMLRRISSVIKPSPESDSMCLPECIHEMQLPCTINGTGYRQVDDTVIEGGYGALFKAHPIVDDGLVHTETTVMIKFARNKRFGYYADLNSEESTALALDMYIHTHYHRHLLDEWSDWLSLDEIKQNVPPTIKVLASESYTPNATEYAYQRVVLVMQYHPIGDIEKISGQHLAHFQQNPAGYVWKLLLDQSCVVSSMNEHFEWIDNDFKSINVLVAGDTRNYKTTSFLKIDYGQSVSMGAVRQQLRSDTGRRFGVCEQGTYVSPIGVRILYRNQIGAARRLEQEMESIDMLALAAAAVHVYNRLVSISDRIHLRASGAGPTEKERRRIVDYNWLMLRTHYNQSKYTNPNDPVESIETLLIRMHWLAFYQVPGNEQGVQLQGRRYLNWKQFRIWLKQARRRAVQTNSHHDPLSFPDCCHCGIS